MTALWIVRQFPRQIRRDLDRFHSRKLADWWRGTRDASGELLLSSDELLDYLEWMDEAGAFKTDADRGGAWPSWQQMLAENTNESYRLRASYHTVSSQGQSTFDSSDYEFVDPAVRRRREIADGVDAEEQQKAQQEFEAEIGFTVA
jgi:hypothetical protein